MAKRPKLQKKILVIDIEATCWDTEEEKSKNTSEIIEIGVAVLNLEKPEPFVEDNESIYIKPVVSKVSPFCTQLTGITQEQVDKSGISFSNAVTYLMRHYDSRNMYWASYGNYDRKMLDKACRNHCVQFPFHDTHFNVKSMANLTFGMLGEEGMPSTLSRLGLELEGTHHSGKDDAYNIAKILRELIVLQRESL